MTPEDQAVQDAINAHAALVSELESIQQEERRLQDRLEEISKRKDELKPWGYRIGSGLIDRAEAHIAEAKRKAVDVKKPQLTVQRGKYYPPITVVVSRVTTKRIYLREVGAETEYFIARDAFVMPYDWEATREQIEALVKATEASCE